MAPHHDRYRPAYTALPASDIDASSEELGFLDGEDIKSELCPRGPDKLLAKEQTRSFFST